MKKYIKYVLGLLGLVVVLGLVACSNGKDLSYTINGIDVPPVPDAVKDAASIGGVDTDGDIIRDKVERMLAEEFGDDPEFYEQAKEYALAEQVAIMDPTEENVADFTKLLSCAEDQTLDDLKKVTDTTIDTRDREIAYGKAFAGALLGGC